MSSQSDGYKRLDHYQTGGVRELFLFSFPLILSLLSQSLMLFGDRLLLSRHSIHALETCTAAQALCVLFQLPCIRITSMTQVFVGQHFGGSRFSLVGPAVWQMIWFSLLSSLIVIPVGFGLQPLFFSSSLLPEGVHYFQLLLWMNFLFPLGNALSCFYLGIGKNRMIIYSQLIAHAIHILLDYLLIYGIPGILPSMGVMGAAYATIFSQFFQCMILFGFFLKPHYRTLYSTHDLKFKWEIFFEGVHIGFPKALARFCVLAVWTCNMHLMMKKGESYLAIVAFGSTLVGTFMFITEGMTQGVVSLASVFIGAKKWDKVWKLYRSSLIFSIGTIAILSLPLIFFSDFTISLFFKSSESTVSHSLLQKTCFWVWLLFISNALNFIGVSFLTASKDTTFHMMANMTSWIVCYLPILFGIGLWNWPEDSFWAVLAAEPLIIASILHLRLRQEKWKRLGMLKTLGLG